MPVIKPARDYSQFAGRKSVAWNRATIENFDLVRIATNHSSVNYHELDQFARCNRGYAERDRRTCPYREEKLGSVIKATADYTDLTDILEP